MISRPGMYGVTPTTSRYTFNAAGDEVDLRVEFDNFIYGLDGSTPHGKYIIIKHMRRDAVGGRVACECLHEDTKEGSPGCSYCAGEGYLWDEVWHVGYAMYSGSDGGMTNRIRWMPPGFVRPDYKIFFFRYDSGLKYGDKIVEAALNTEGAVESPLIREAIYRPETVAEHRSDGGRTEFIAAYCVEADAFRPDNIE